MTTSREGRVVFRIFCLIGMGIPVVLFVFVTALFFSPWAISKAQVSNSVLNIAMIGLAAGGLIIWLFFSFLLYRRLWKLFPYIAEKEKGWSYAEGTFGLVGVGASMSSVLGVFYYLLSGDFSRSLALIAFSLLLALVESAMFPNRIADVEEIIAGMD